MAPAEAAVPGAVAPVSLPRARRPFPRAPSAASVATLRAVGQSKLTTLNGCAAANDAALRITDTAMRVCGGAAFSEHLQVDRFFRDARAGHVMAPTADVLYDFYGKAITGQELF